MHEDVRMQPPPGGARSTFSFTLRGVIKMIGGGTDVWLISKTNFGKTGNWNRGFH